MPNAKGPPPRISLVVPSYNQAHFLPECLESIFRQGYPHLEVVLMDGGSTDGSVAVIEKYAPRLKYWQSQKDGGQSAAINAGVTHCTGDLVGWLNSDDFFWRDALWTVADAWAAYPGRGLYIGNGLRYEQATGKYTPFCPRHVALNREALVRGTDTLLQPSTFMLRQAWVDAGGLDRQLNFCMDWDIFIRIAAAHPAVLINEFLGVSREYEETKTRSGKMERAFEIVRMVRRHTQEAVTPGSLMYLLDTLMDVTADKEPEDVRAALTAALHGLSRKISLAWGGGHGFPEESGPDDSIYIPFPGAAAPRPAADLPAPPSFSLVLPSRAEGPLVAQTLAGLASQDYAGLETVVVDHRPADGGLGPAPADDDATTTRLSAPGLNRAAALNRGLAQARGEILAWLNPGDLPTDGALWAAAEKFAADPELDVVYANAVHADAAGQFYAPMFTFCRNGFWIGEPPVAVGPNSPQQGCYPLPPSAVYFRRRALGRCGGFDETVPDGFCDHEFLCRLFAGSRVHKLERTQVVCLARRVDAAEWWSEWYRRSRRRWPGRLSKQFPPVLTAYLRHYLHRKFWGKPRDSAFWWTAVRAGLAAATGFGNPERWLPAYPIVPPEPPRPAPEVAPEPAPAAPEAATPVAPEPTLAAAAPEVPTAPTAPEVICTLPLFCVEGLYSSLFCGPLLPALPGASGSEAREYRVLSLLKRHSTVQFFAQYPSRGRRAAPDERAPTDAAYSPESLAEEWPRLVNPDDLRMRPRSRAFNRLRRLNLPLPGPRNPLSITRQLRYVRAFCRTAIQGVVDEHAPDFLFVAGQTNPLALTLDTAGRETRTVLVAHAVEGARFTPRLLDAGGRMEAARARDFERRNLACYDGVLAATEADRRLLSELYGYPAERVLVMGMGADPDYWGETRRDPDPDVVLFRGCLGLPENRRAAERLAQKILPLVLKSRPGARLRIVNTGRPRDGRGAFAANRVQVVSRPAEDYRDCLAAAAVACVPTPAGGVEAAALDLLAAGLPLVCGPAAVDGLGLEAGRHYLAGRDDRELAAALCRVLEDRALAARLGREGAGAAQARPWRDAAPALGDWLAGLKQMPRLQEEGAVAPAAVAG